jgi:chromosome partitioning protein
MAAAGQRVILLDADPNQPLVQWANRAGAVTDQLIVEGGIRQDTITDAITDARSRAQWVIVDTEGTAALTSAYVVWMADLVLIPCQGSQLDAREGARAVQLIQQQSKLAQRSIPTAVVMTRTSGALRSRTLAHVRDAFAARSVAILPVGLVDREAYRAMFAVGATVRTLSDTDVSGLSSARANAKAFAQAVVDYLASVLSTSAA